MEIEFIPYDLAIRLKSLGFNETCFAYYNHKKELYDISPDSFTAKNSGVHYNVKIYNIFNKSVQRKLCTAPTWKSAFKWFRDEHQIYHEIGTDCTTSPKFSYGYNRFYGNPKDLTEREWYWVDGVNSFYLYRTYEEAEYECLDKLIELIESNLTSCSCDGGVMVCPGCNGEQSKFGVCAGCHGKGEVVCGKCNGKIIENK